MVKRWQPSRHSAGKGTGKCSTKPQNKQKRPGCTSISYIYLTRSKITCCSHCNSNFNQAVLWADEPWKPCFLWLKALGGEEGSSYPAPECLCPTISCVRSVEVTFCNRTSLKSQSQGTQKLLKEIRRNLVWWWFLSLPNSAEICPWVQEHTVLA